MINDKTKTASLTALPSKFAMLLLKILQGALIGLGSVLPGISGGVLSVVFGVYKIIMELLASPLQNFRTHIPRLLPYMLGSLIGFLGVANILARFLNRYPGPCVCLFAGLIIGMLPSLWQEAGLGRGSHASQCGSHICIKSRTKGSLLSMLFAFIAVLSLLSGLNRSSFMIAPSFTWYLFCGFCLALSIIAPGMSFSTLLMPLGLYTPFIDGIGHLEPAVLVPGALGALCTIACLVKPVNFLFEKHNSLASHAILGIISAATLTVIPFRSFASSEGSINLLYMTAGILCALVLEHFNSNAAASRR